MGYAGDRRQAAAAAAAASVSGAPVRGSRGGFQGIVVPAAAGAVTRIAGSTAAAGEVKNFLKILVFFFFFFVLFAEEEEPTAGGLWMVSAAAGATSLDEVGDSRRGSGRRRPTSREGEIDGCGRRCGGRLSGGGHNRGTKERRLGGGAAGGRRFRSGRWRGAHPAVVVARRSPILTAASSGISEMVEKILDKYPAAIQDTDNTGKNIVLLATQFRHPNVLEIILQRSHIIRSSVFGKFDNDGNNALQVAASYSGDNIWNIPGAALQMQCEIKWFKFIQRLMEPDFFSAFDSINKKARETFTEQHKKLVIEGGKWLKNTSQSCSVVAALVATVAFTSATAVPGGINDQSGTPILEGKPAFLIFAVAALIALCFSVTSLTMFLYILTSRYQEMDFEKDLPVKLIIGLSSLFISIASMLVSFCAGYFFVVEMKLKHLTYSIYGVMCLPLYFFVVAQFQLYIDLLSATISRVPARAPSGLVI